MALASENPRPPLFVQLGLLITLLFATAANSTERVPRRLALLIGIDDYYQLSARPWPRLHTGRELDALRQILISRWSFSSQDILLLSNHQATKEGIKQAFRDHLINKVRPGDIVFIHFSGHGQQLVDDNGDELDGLDESLVPYDAIDRSAAAGAKTNIRDDELQQWLRELAARLHEGTTQRGSITVSIDSCFSGTVTRGSLVERGRGWDIELDGPTPRPQPGGRADGASALLATEEAGSGHYVLLAAARSDQIAHEEDGMGVYSRALIHALASAVPGTQVTYQTLFDKISIDVSSTIPEQNPQIEGLADTLLFSNSTADTNIYSHSHGAVRIQLDKERQLSILAGKLHGVTAQSVYALYPEECDKFDTSTQIGEAVVHQVDLLRSELTLRSSGKELFQKISAKGMIGIETEHSYSTEPLRLYWHDGRRTNKRVSRCTELRAHSLKQSIIVNPIASAEHFDVSVFCDEKLGQIEIRRASSNKPIATIPIHRTTEESLTLLLKGMWRWRYMSRLQQDNPQARVQLKLIPVSVLRSSSGTMLTPPQPIAHQIPTSNLKMPNDSYFMIELENLSTTPLYVTIIELGSDGSIDVLFPQHGSSVGNLIAADGKPHMPDYRPYVYRLYGPFGQRSLLKLFATREPIDLSGVVQSALQRRTRSGMDQRAPTGPLACLLQDLIAGERSTASSAVHQVWGTSEAWIEISR